MKTSLIVLVTAALVSACALPTYRQAERSGSRHMNGYLSRQVGQDVYLIEFNQNGGYAIIFKNEEVLATMRQMWRQRAAELCPHGYTGEPHVVHASRARIPEFQCLSHRDCEFSAVASGLAKCTPAKAPPEA